MGWEEEGQDYLSDTTAAPQREPLIHKLQGVVDARDWHDLEDGAKHLLHNRQIEGGLDYRGCYESPPNCAAFRIVLPAVAFKQENKSLTRSILVARTCWSIQLCSTHTRQSHYS